MSGARALPAAQEVARLREQVLDLGEALATLTGQLGTLTGEVYEQRFAVMDLCSAFAKAFRAEGRPVPDQIAKFAPAVMAQPEPLVAVEGGGRRSAPRRPGLRLVREEDR